MKITEQDKTRARSWFRANYGNRYKQRVLKTFDEHNEQKATGILPEVWAFWYYYPTGDKFINRQFRVMREMLIGRNEILKAVLYVRRYKLEQRKKRRQ